MERDFAKDQEAYANEKAQLQAQQGATMQNETMGSTQTWTQPTFAEQHEKQAVYHREEAAKNLRATDFFHLNPAFDEFVRLVREGIIKLY